MENRVALITGASDGVGEQVACALAAGLDGRRHRPHGSKVHRVADALTCPLRGRFRGSQSGQSWPAPVDDFPRVDVLANNAGASSPPGPTYGTKSPTRSTTWPTLLPAC